jgi:PhoPQ-activated pathogenicity-related protein
VCNWEISQHGRQLVLSVETSPEQLQGALLWSADSEDRDFRDETWSSLIIEDPLQKNMEVLVELPESGFRAFYLDLIYPDPNGGEYTKSTRMFVADDSQVL